MLPGARNTGAWKVPSPLPFSTAIRPDPELATTRSGLLSRLKSPIVTKNGPPSTARLRGAWNVPSPLPSSTTTVLDPVLAMARSGRPSPLKSPAVTELGPTPAANGHRRLKRSVAIAEEHGDGVASGVGDGQIRPAVPVEVRDRDRLRTGALPQVHRSRGLEGSVAVADQHRGGVVAGIREREILHEVAVEIARRDRRRTMSGRVVPVGREVNRLRRHGRGKHLEQQERGNTQRYPRACLGHGDLPLVESVKWTSYPGSRKQRCRSSSVSTLWMAAV